MSVQRPKHVGFTGRWPEGKNWTSAECSPRYSADTDHCMQVRTLPVDKSEKQNKTENIKGNKTPVSHRLKKLPVSISQIRKPHNSRHQLEYLNGVCLSDGEKLV